MPSFFKIKILQKYLIKAACIFLVVAGHSSTLGAGIASENRYILEGALTTEKLQKFQDALKENPDIKELELINSKGSADNAGPIVFGFIRAIDRLKIKTFARGRCFSSCAVVFLMGYERTLLPGTANDATTLMLHAARDNTNDEFMSRLTNMVNEKITERSNGKISKALLDTMYQAKNKYGGLYIARKVKPGLSNVHFWTGDPNDDFAPVGQYTLDQLGIQYGEDAP